MEHPLFKRMSLYLLAIGLIAGLLPVSPANAAKCTSKEISSLKSIDMKMAIASISGDLTELFAEIEKARNATKNKTLKAFYSKLEAAVEEDNGVLKFGPSRQMWKSLQAKYMYSRC